MPCFLSRHGLKFNTWRPNLPDEDDNFLIELIEHDAKVHFIARATRGKVQQGWVLLDLLDERDKP